MENTFFVEISYLITLTKEFANVPNKSLEISRHYLSMDFVFWGYLKDKVYRTKPRTIDALKSEIER